MKETIHKYALALIGLWGKSFGYKHVISWKSVVGRLEKLTLNYYKVYNIANRRSVKIRVSKKTNINKTTEQTTEINILRVSISR